MKKLTDYKEEIHKCSKCGLCQSVCPVYQVTGNDCAVSRGKFIMLNGIIKGDLKLNKNVNKYLDMCLKCNACKDFCPSGIDVCRIFSAAKEEYFEAENSKFVKILNSMPVFNLIMNLLKLTANTYRFLRLDKFLRFFYPILIKCKLGLGQRIILANEFVSFPLFPLSFPLKQSTKIAIRIVYFTGCVNEYINPRAKIAAENVLKRMGVEVLPAKFQCCGVPFLSCGNAEQFKKQAEFNLVQIPDEFDYFLTDCATCQNAFKEYENYIDDEKLFAKLKKINEKSINIVNFIVKNAESIEFSEKNSFTFHKPCHMENIDFVKEFLAKSKNVEYVEMKDFDKCCGFSGAFAVKNPKISGQISKEKVQNAVETRADYILTSCPACILGLTQGLIDLQSIHHSPFTIHHFIEFIAKAEIKT
ncbi:MAG: (Fe-S)-binding protein [Candidatus Gastranaerophilales bacterium]|nr:(Fe-S)-binding protein [Candidatus Gastranaerophilales bacterium]